MSNGEPVMAEAYLGEDGAFQENWLGNLPEDTFEKDDTGKVKQGDLAEHKGLASIVKSYLNKDKLLGTAIQPLAEDATDEQKKAHRVKVGCPETVAGYEITKPTLPEGMAFDEELIKSASQYAHDKHMPKGVFEGLAKLVIERQMTTTKEMMAAAAKAQTEAQTEKDKTITTAENELKGEWGAEYDKNLEMANRFYDLPGDDATNKAFAELMEEKGLNHHPAVVKFFREAYKLVKEDEIPGGGGPAGKTRVPGQLDYSTVHGNSAVNK